MKYLVYYKLLCIFAPLFNSLKTLQYEYQV